MRPEISVIIPAYNTEKYIMKCIASILVQDFTNYEIIVVDDGSMDNTAAIIEEYSFQYKFIKLIKHSKNLGQGLARNSGIEHAQGKYIFFIDSDDWIEVDTLSKMHFVAETNEAEIVGCGMWLVDESGNKNVYYSQKYNLDNGINILELVSESLIILTGCKFFKKEFIDRCHLRFYDYYYEDAVFLYEAVYRCKKYVDIPDMLYNYYKRNNSTTRMQITEKHIYSWIMFFCSVDKMISKSNSSNQVISMELKDKIYSHLKSLMTGMLFMNLKHYTDKELSILLDNYKKMFGEKNYFICSFIEMFFDKLKSNEHIMQFFMNAKNKKLIVFGTGSVSQKLLCYIPNEIAYFIDNNSNNWNNKFSNRQVFSPKCLLQENKDLLTIIVASQAYQQIAKQLMDMGFEENKHFWNGYNMIS